MSDNVIDLDQQRAPADTPLDGIDASLPPGEPADQVKAIVEMDDPVGFLQNLDSQVFYQLIKSAGWDQTHDLIHYATPRQIQNFFDFDCWTRDRLISDKLDKWLLALVTDADDDKLKEVCRNLDPEVLAIYFKRYLEVDELDEGRIPDHLEGDVATSPDGVYAIVYPPNEDKAALMRALIDRLYSADRVLAWTLLEAVRWELISEMEEFAYKWRNSRLEEFGFVSRQEAVEVYAYVNPSRYRERVGGDYTPDERVERLDPGNLDLPAVLEDELDDEFFVYDALSQIDDADDVERIVYQIGALANRTMIADGIEPGELDSGREVIRRTLGYLSLGLEFLSRANLELAGAHLANLPVKRIFQAGFSLPRKLQSRLESLTNRPTLSIVDGDRYSLLDDDMRALAESLARPRPPFAWDRLSHEIFKSQAQLDSAAFRIGMLAFKQVWLFGVASESVEALAELVYSDQSANTPASVTFDTLFRTWMAHFILGDEASLTPMGSDEIMRLAGLVSQAPWDEPSGGDRDGDDGDQAGYFGPLIDRIEASIPVESTRLFTRWVNQNLERLVDEFGPLTSLDNPGYVQDVLLVVDESL